MRIEEITDPKKYMSLLLEADPEEKVINEYIDQGKMYGVFEENQLVAEAFIIKVDEKTYELKNLATTLEARGKGYASLLIQFLFMEYRNCAEKMIVGTSENMIPFYVKNGFDHYEKTKKNFFIDHYQQEIWDGDFQCIDMYYYAKNLR